MSIFITGDTHGDFTRFKKEVFYEQAGLTKDDSMIICGDFGGVWDDSREERCWLDWRPNHLLPCSCPVIMKTMTFWQHIR